MLLKKKKQRSFSFTPLEIAKSWILSLSNQQLRLLSPTGELSPVLDLQVGMTTRSRQQEQDSLVTSTVWGRGRDPTQAGMTPGVTGPLVKVNSLADRNCFHHEAHAHRKNQLGAVRRGPRLPRRGWSVSFSTTLGGFLVRIAKRHPHARGELPALCSCHSDVDDVGRGLPCKGCKRSDFKDEAQAHPL